MNNTEKLINWFRTLSESEMRAKFPDFTPTEKNLKALPEYAKINTLLYNGVK